MSSSFSTCFLRNTSWEWVDSLVIPPALYEGCFPWSSPSASSSFLSSDPKGEKVRTMDPPPPELLSSMEGGGEAAEERNEEGCDTTDTNAEERLLGTPPPPSSSSSSSPHAQEWRRKEEHDIKDASHTTDAVLDSLEVLRSQIIVGRQTRQDRRMHRISFTAEERCRLASASETLPPNGPMDSEGKHDMVIPPPPTAPSRSMPDAGQKARIPNPSEVDASNVRRFKLYVHALLESILCPSTECFSSSSSSSSTTTTTTTTTTNHAVQQKDPRDPFSRLTSEKKPQPPPREGEETKKNWDSRENPTGHVTRSREVEELWCYLQHIDTKLQANLLLDKQAWAAEGLSQDSNAPASPTEALLSSPKKKKERMDPDETSGTNGVFSDLARLFASVEAEHTMEHDKDDDDKEEEKKKKKKDGDGERRGTRTGVFVSSLVSFFAHRCLGGGAAHGWVGKEGLTHSPYRKGHPPRERRRRNGSIDPVPSAGRHPLHRPRASGGTIDHDRHRKREHIHFTGLDGYGGAAVAGVADSTRAALLSRADASSGHPRPQRWTPKRGNRGRQGRCPTWDRLSTNVVPDDACEASCSFSFSYPFSRKYERPPEDGNGGEPRREHRRHLLRTTADGHSRGPSPSLTIF